MIRVKNLRMSYGNEPSKRETIEGEGKYPTNDDDDDVTASFGKISLAG